MKWLKRIWTSVKRYYRIGGTYRDSYVCSNCHSKISNPNFCRQCGASEESGWSSASDGDFGSGYGNEDDFDYDEFLEREFPGKNGPKKGSFSQLLVTLIIVLLCVCFAVLSMGIF